MRRCVGLALASMFACNGEEPIRAPAVLPCGDLAAGSWDERLELAGLAGSYASVRTMVATERGIVVGGTFERAPGIALRNVGRWDGAAWAPMGDGLPGVVVGLAVDDRGTVWAVGVPSVDDDDAGYVATWDGASWRVVADVLDGAPRGVTALDTGVAVYGSFQRVGGVDAPGLARWDGEAWSSGGLDRYAVVFTLVREPAGFCAGGRFGATAQGLASGDVAACWRAGSWTALGTPLPSIPLALARGRDGTWWAGGSLVAPEDRAQPVPPRGLARLDGDGVWRIVDGGVFDGDGFFPGGMARVIVPEEDGVLIAGDFIAVGSDRLAAHGIARWSPRSGWSAVASPGLTELGWRSGEYGGHALLRDGDRLHVGGTFAGIGATMAVNVATLERDGAVTAWTGGRIALGPQAWVTSLAATDGGVVAAGAIFTGATHGPVATFAGTWSAPPPPSWWGGATKAVRMSDGGYVISGEDVLRWDGVAWTTVATRTLDSPLLVDGDGAVYFADHDELETLTEIRRLASDGSLASLGHVEGRVSDLAVLDGELVAASLASYQDPAASGVLWIRSVDGDWRRVDGGPRGGITDLAVSPALGVAAGSWSGELAAWDGARWRTLVEDGAGVIAGCDRGVVSAHTLRPAELWFHDGTAWSPLGASTRGDVTALEMTDLGLAVGVGRPGEPSLQLLRPPRREIGVRVGGNATALR